MLENFQSEIKKRRFTFLSHWPIILLLFPYTAFLLWGLPYIPFHPDESTQLYMSSDFEALFTQPASLFWKPENRQDPRQIYRELDAPITKYLLGFGRSLRRLPAPPVDWDWSLSWDQNLAAGAYPSPTLINTARLTITLLLPITTILIYAIGVQIRGRLMGIIAAALFALNPVVLLHGRRAMAEGALLLGVTLVTWSLSKARRYPWLAGLALALAFNAKQSTLFLFPVGMIATIWAPGVKRPHRTPILKNILTFTTVFVIVTLFLNPLYWRHPIQAARSALTARAQLMQAQATGTTEIAPEKAMTSFPQRVLVLFLNLYLSPPEYGLVANLAPTQPQLDTYLAMPGHNLFRGIFWGTILFIFTLYGTYMAIRKIMSDPPHNQGLIFFLAAFATSTLGNLTFLQVYWIRYSLAITPFIPLCIAFAITSIPIKQKAAP